MMTEVVVWIAAVAAALTIIVAILKVGMWASAVSQDLSDLKKSISRLEEAVRALLAAHPDVLVTLYQRNWPGASDFGHSQASEKDILLEKLKQMTISSEEALRLRHILEEERKTATGMASVAIGGLLALLDVIIEASQPPKIKAKGGK